MNILLLLDSYTADSEIDRKYDLLAEEFSRKGHKVFAVSFQNHPIENETMLTEEYSVTVLRVKKLFFTHTLWLKDIFQPKILLKHIKHYFKGIHFDLIISAAPSVISPKTIHLLKKYYTCPSYLLLRSLFPQVSKDLQLVRNPAVSYYLKRKEKQLYDLSNWIGCISPEMMKFLSAQYPVSLRKKMDYLPDWSSKAILDLISVREKWKLSDDAKLAVFEYAPEEEWRFLLDIAEANKENEKLFFIISGKTTKEERSLIDERGLNNILFLSSSMKADKEKLLADADIGLILLNRELSVPVVPSHIGRFMSAGLPLIVCENPFTHFSFIVKEAACGLVCYTGNLEHFQKDLSKLLSDKGMRERMGENGKMYAEKELTAEKAYNMIMKHFQD